MSITYVSMSWAVMNPAGGSIVINTPSGAQVGDGLVFITVQRTSGFGTPTSWSTVPSGAIFVDNLRAEGLGQIYSLYLTSSPASSYTFTTSTNRMGHIVCVCIRGFQKFDTAEGLTHFVFGDVHSVHGVSPTYIPSFPTTVANEMRIWASVSYTFGAVIGVPNGATQIYGQEVGGSGTSTYLAVGYETLAEQGVVAQKSVPTTGTTDDFVAGLRVMPETNGDFPYLDTWRETTDLGLISSAGVTWNIISDTSGPYVYAIRVQSALESSSSYDSVTLRILKINRRTRTVEKDQTYASYTGPRFSQFLAQDETYLYVVPGNQTEYIRIRKVDLHHQDSSEEWVTYYAIPPSSTTIYGSQGLAIGKGWSAGKLWTKAYGSDGVGTSGDGAGSPGGTLLLSWDINTGEIVDTINISGLEFGAGPIWIDDNGDIWTTGGDRIDYTDDGLKRYGPIRIFRIDSSHTVTMSDYLDDPPVYHDICVPIFREGGCFDAAGRSIILYSSVQEKDIASLDRTAPTTRWIRKINIDNFPTITEVASVAVANQSSDISISNCGNTIPEADSCAFGEESFFISTFPASLYDGASYEGSGTSLLQYSTVNLSPIMRMQLPYPYYGPVGSTIDPEGRLWTIARKGIAGSANDTMVVMNNTITCGPHIGDGAGRILAYGIGGGLSVGFP